MADEQAGFRKDRSTTQQILGKIHSLCNQAWIECHVPEKWLKSVLVPIPKKGVALECKDYRTISLISHIGKYSYDPTEKIRCTVGSTYSRLASGIQKG